MCEIFILQMLTNLHDLSLDRIHMNLMMTLPTYDRSMLDLAGFLDKLVKQEKLVESAGVYSKGQPQQE